jgi:hypothetical protein
MTVRVLTGSAFADVDRVLLAAPRSFWRVEPCFGASVSGIRGSETILIEIVASGPSLSGTARALGRPIGTVDHSSAIINHDQ